MCDQDMVERWADPSRSRFLKNFADTDSDVPSYKAAFELFLGTFDQAALGILHIQVDGRVILQNQSARRILGYASEDLSQEFFEQLIHSEDRPKAREWQSLLLSGAIKLYSLECRLRHTMGHYVWTQVTVALQHSPHAPVTHSIATVQDISERKKAEEKYRRAKEELHLHIAQLEAIIGHLPQAVLIFNREGELQRANPAAIRMQVQRLLAVAGEGSSPGLRLRSDDGQEIEPGDWLLDMALRGESVTDVIYEVLDSSDVPTSWYCFNTAPVLGQDGQLLLIILTVHDISHQKRSELALRESELRYRQLADSMPHIVWVSDPQGELTFFNRRWYEFTGTSEVKDYDDELWHALVHPEDLTEIQSRFAQCVQTGETLEIEVRLKNRQTAAYEWYLVKSAPAKNDRGEITSWYGTSTNIQHQKMVESKLRRADKAKDEFFAVLSHELRSPLNVILGYTDLLKRRESCPLDLDEAIEAIERNALAQTQLVGDLLEISRIIGGKLPFERQRFDPRVMIHDAFESVRFAAAAKEIELTATVDPGVQQLEGDPQRLRQILWNLLSNAIKFTPEHGAVRLSARGQGEWYEVRIEDTGIGLPPEALGHVFDRFWQEDTLETHRQFGLGLGLSIVRHLTEMHGGRVWAESEGRGQGAVFVVCLPLSRALPLEAKAPSKPRAHELKSPMAAGGRELEGHCLLVVDDQEDATRLLHRILSDAGAEVHCASSGADAFKLFTQKKFDLVLSDIAMPDMDGLDLMRAIRSWERERTQNATPAIAIATYAGEFSHVQATEAGFQRHLIKPISYKILLQEVITVLHESAGTALPSSWTSTSTGEGRASF